MKRERETSESSDWETEKKKVSSNISKKGWGKNRTVRGKQCFKQTWQDFFFLIGIHSIQGLTATTRMKKERIKDVC